MFILYDAYRVLGCKSLLPVKETTLTNASPLNEDVVEERENGIEGSDRLEDYDYEETRDVQLEKCFDDNKRRRRSRQHSLLETFDVESVNMNDGEMVTILIKVRILTFRRFNGTKLKLILTFLSVIFSLGNLRHKDPRKVQNLILGKKRGHESSLLVI